MLLKLRKLFTFSGIMLLLGTIVTDEWTSFGERFSYAVIAICILIACQPSAALRFLQWLPGFIASSFCKLKLCFQNSSRLKCNTADDVSYSTDEFIACPSDETSQTTTQQITAEFVQELIVDNDYNVNLPDSTPEESKISIAESSATPSAPDNIPLADIACSDVVADEALIHDGPEADSPIADKCNSSETNESIVPCDIDSDTENSSPNNQPVDIFDSIRDPNIMSHYIVLDIETTGLSRDNDRIIEIAAIHYVFGEEAKRFHTYINPQIPIPKHITKLTGIRQSDVETAPLLEDIVDDFREFISGYPLVGHNIINFDLPFLASHLNLDEPNLVIDTLDMSRFTFPMLPSHKLSDLNYWFNLDNGTSHRADADAAATNALLWACLYPDKYMSLYRKAIRNGPPEIKHSHTPKSYPSSNRVNISDITASPSQATKFGPLSGRKIVFTGELSISRKDAMQMAVDAGALLRSSVSSKTDILVVGKQDLSVVGPDGMSSKQEKAHELNTSGKGSIKVIGEEEFMSMITVVPN